MAGYVLTPRARDDLSAIWDCAAARWGIDQADRYVRQIASACADLAAGRKHGRSAEAIRPSFFHFSVGSHVVFFKAGELRETVVVRVLHQSMDVDRHL